MFGSCSSTYAAISLDAALGASCLLLNILMFVFYSHKRHRGRPIPGLYRALNLTNTAIGAVALLHVIILSFTVKGQVLQTTEAKVAHSSLGSPPSILHSPSLHSSSLHSSSLHSRLILISLVLFHTSTGGALFANLLLSITRSINLARPFQLVNRRFLTAAIWSYTVVMFCVATLDIADLWQVDLVCYI